MNKFLSKRSGLLYGLAQPHFTRMKNVDYRYLEAVCLDQHRLAHFVGSGEDQFNLQGLPVLRYLVDI